MKMGKMLSVLLLVPVLLFAESLSDRLAMDLKSDKLTREEYLKNSLRAVFSPEELPEEYRAFASEPMKCATPLLLETLPMREQLAKELPGIAASWSNRPGLPFSYLSASGRFRIHYTDAGSHAVKSTDDDNSGIPDFVETAAEALDDAYVLLVEQSGYQPPPADREVDGPEWDMYFQNESVYGYTNPETAVSTAPLQYTSYIIVNNQFGPSFKTRGLNAVRITCVHEFFHMIQLGYIYRESDLFFYESSSTWIEDFAYDDVNDYFYYLDSFFQNPAQAFDTFNGRHEYGLCLWNHMIDLKYGPEAIFSIWENMPNLTATEAMDRVFLNQNSSFLTELEQFSLWNFFTEYRADSINYYEEGQFYPLVTPRKNYTFSGSASIVDSLPRFSTGYYYFDDPDRNREFAVAIQQLYPRAAGESANSSYTIDLMSAPRNAEQIEVASDLFAQMQAPEEEKLRVNIIIRPDNGPVSITTLTPNSVTTASETRIYPNPYIVEAGSNLNIDFEIENREWVEVKILTANGQVIRDLETSGMIPGYVNPGRPWTQWDGRSSNGEYVGSGVYIINIIGESFIKYEKVAVIRR